MGGPLAFDLILRVAPLPQILAAYNLTEPQFGQLLGTPAFVAAQRDAQAQMKEHGASTKKANAAGVRVGFNLASGIQGMEHVIAPLSAMKADE